MFLKIGGKYGPSFTGIFDGLSFEVIQVYIFLFISCFPVGYREISVKIFFDLTLVPPVKIPIFMFWFPRLIASASQPDGNMTSFTLHFSRLTSYCNKLLCGRGTQRGITEKNVLDFDKTSPRNG